MYHQAISVSKETYDWLVKFKHDHNLCSFDAAIKELRQFWEIL